MAKSGKNPIGPPIKYDPAMCEKIIELMKDGLCITEVAYELNIARSTIYVWMETYPELSDAIKIGKEFEEGNWRKHGRTNLYNKEFNSTLWYMNMKNRFGWKDKQEHQMDITARQEDVLKELG